MFSLLFQRRKLVLSRRIPAFYLRYFCRAGFLIDIFSQQLSCLFFLPDALQVVIAQALRARGDVLVPTITHMISYAIIMTPLAWWFAIPLGHGLVGIVWAVIIASFAAMGFLGGRWLMLARRL